MDDDLTLHKLLFLNKRIYISQRQNIYKQALLWSQPELLPIKRVAIWTNILKLRQNNSDYEAFKLKVAADPSMISKVEEVIELDVQRSSHNMTGVDPRVLTSVLKTYAYYNPEIEYC